MAEHALGCMYMTYQGFPGGFLLMKEKVFIILWDTHVTRDLYGWLNKQLQGWLNTHLYGWLNTHLSAWMWRHEADRAL